MNIFKISKNMSLNIFSIVGYVNIIWQIIFVKQVVENFNILQTDASAITGRVMLTGCNIIIGSIIILFFSIASLTERMISTHAFFKINEEYKRNKFAIIYFYCGIAGNILPFILSFVVLKFS